MSVLIRNAETVALLDPGRREIRGGWVLFDEGVIRAVGEPGNEPAGAGEIVGARGAVVLPGLVNTHHHFFQTLTRAFPGAADSSLFPWLRALYPAWAGLTREAVRTASLTAMAELLLSGCTTTSDHHYLFTRACSDPTDATIESALAIGIRLHATRGSMSLSEKDGGLPPDSVVQDEETILRDSVRLIERYHDPSPGARVRIALAPCSPFSVTEDLMRETARIASSYGVRLHTHLAETKDEEEYCLARYGVRPLDFLERAGWLADRTWIAHGIHFEPQEIDRIGRARMGVAHCPSSNMRLGSGAAPVLDLLAAGAKVGLGVDGSASNDASSIAAEARQALFAGRLRYGAERVAADEVLRWATRGGAEILGRDDIGRIAPGFRADLALFRLDDIAFWGAGDPIAALLLSGPARVDTLFVEGRAIVREGRLLTIDLDQHRERHHLAARALAAGS
ncbi:MAG: 8-oxoguanine deaminase [Candidatus Eisenbacteria bacterium]|nr:8-oxoguanine deaminase [Candidatus Eisenbacteria bacterium]